MKNLKLEIGHKCEIEFVDTLEFVEIIDTDEAITMYRRQGEAHRHEFCTMPTNRFKAILK